jgi:hypothetical protein
VTVIDNLGNELMRVEGTVVSEPAGTGARLQLGMPVRIVATRRAIYSADGVNNRIIRVGVGCLAEATCRIP